jgi:hypothetical protein
VTALTRAVEVLERKKVKKVGRTKKNVTHDAAETTCHGIAPTYQQSQGKNWYALLFVI